MGLLIFSALIHQFQTIVPAVRDLDFWVPLWMLVFYVQYWSRFSGGRSRVLAPPSGFTIGTIFENFTGVIGAHVNILFEQNSSHNFQFYFKLLLLKSGSHSSSKADFHTAWAIFSCLWRIGPVAEYGQNWDWRSKFITTPWLIHDQGSGLNLYSYPTWLSAPFLSTSCTVQNWSWAKGHRWTGHREAAAAGHDPVDACSFNI